MRDWNFEQKIERLILAYKRQSLNNHHSKTPKHLKAQYKHYKHGQIEALKNALEIIKTGTCIDYDGLVVKDPYDIF